MNARVELEGANAHPVAYARVRRGRDCWILEAECPCCGKTHQHGGGELLSPPSYGHRAAHCLGAAAGGYVLVPDDGA